MVVLSSIILYNRVMYYQRSNINQYEIYCRYPQFSKHIYSLKFSFVKLYIITLLKYKTTGCFVFLLAEFDGLKFDWICWWQTKTFILCLPPFSPPFFYETECLRAEKILHNHEICKLLPHHTSLFLYRASNLIPVGKVSQWDCLSMCHQGQF